MSDLLSSDITDRMRRIYTERQIHQYPQFNQSQFKFRNQKCLYSRVVNTDFLHCLLSFPAEQPFSQQLLQLQEFKVGFLVLLTQVEDDLQPLQQLPQALIFAFLSRLGQVLFSA